MLRFAQIHMPRPTFLPVPAVKSYYSCQQLSIYHCSYCSRDDHPTCWNLPWLPLALLSPAPGLPTSWIPGSRVFLAAPGSWLSRVVLAFPGSWLSRVALVFLGSWLSWVVLAFLGSWLSRVPSFPGLLAFPGSWLSRVFLAVPGSWLSWVLLAFPGSWLPKEKEEKKKGKKG